LVGGVVDLWETRFEILAENPLRLSTPAFVHRILIFCFGLLQW
jgi:hypothetical protein